MSQIEGDQAGGLDDDRGSDQKARWHPAHQPRSEERRAGHRAEREGHQGQARLQGRVAHDRLQLVGEDEHHPERAQRVHDQRHHPHAPVAIGDHPQGQ